MLLFSLLYSTDAFSWGNRRNLGGILDSHGPDEILSGLVWDGYLVASYDSGDGGTGASFHIHILIIINHHH